MGSGLGQGRVGLTRLLVAALLVVSSGAAVVASPISALVLIMAVSSGALYLAIPAAWFAVCSLSFVTFLAVLFPVNAAERLLAIGPLSGRGSLAIACLILAASTALKTGPAVLAKVGKITMLAALFLLLFVTFSLVNGAKEPEVLFVQFTIWASAFVLALCVPWRLVSFVVRGWILLAFAEGAYAIYEFLAKPEALYESYFSAGYEGPAPTLNATLGGLIRAQGTFGHPIPLASFLIAGALLALFAVRFPSGRRLGTARALVVAIIVAGTVATFSRSAWIALVVAGSIGLTSRQISSRSRVALLAVFILAIVLVLPTSLGESIGLYVTNSANTISYDQRVAGIQSVPSFLSTGLKPVIFGVGVGSQESLYGQINLRSVEGLYVLDNQYISLLVQVGLLSVLAFFALVLRAGTFVWQTVSMVPDSENARTVWGLAVTLLALLVAIFFYDGLGWPSTAVVVWSVIGFLARREQDGLLSSTVIPERKEDPHAI